MHRTTNILIFVLGLLGGLACAQENESHCANQAGAKTCVERGYTHCSICSAMNDGCTDEMPMPSCLPGVADTGTAATGTSSASNTGDTSTSTTVGGSNSTSSGTAPESSSSMGEDPTTGGSTCGNAVIDEDEDCDGADLGAQTCESRGFPGGSLSCALDCRFDESACDVIEGCGNGTREGDEQCDQSDFGGSTCTTYSAQYGGGALMCNENCTIDPSACCVASGQNCQLSPCCAELSCSIVLDTCL